ncbi:hypothetical protein R3P38DRAFT_3262839 [Favolaschia claudopus]|uniref:Uncharacterized protein n=1 Tax=Favolaschia claudopus TaxID=2862362 RepID=A0AAW0CJ76_9AGAR
MLQNDLPCAKPALPQGSKLDDIIDKAHAHPPTSHSQHLLRNAGKTRSDALQDIRPPLHISHPTPAGTEITQTRAHPTVSYDLISSRPIPHLLSKLLPDLFASELCSSMTQTELRYHCERTHDTDTLPSLSPSTATNEMVSPSVSERYHHPANDHVTCMRSAWKAKQDPLYRPGLYMSYVLLAKVSTPASQLTLRAYTSCKQLRTNNPSPPGPLAHLFGLQKYSKLPPPQARRSDIRAAARTATRPLRQRHEPHPQLAERHTISIHEYAPPSMLSQVRIPEAHNHRQLHILASSRCARRVIRLQSILSPLHPPLAPPQNPRSPAGETDAFCGGRHMRRPTSSNGQTHSFVIRLEWLTNLKAPSYLSIPSPSHPAQVNPPLQPRQSFTTHRLEALSQNTHIRIDLLLPPSPSSAPSLFPAQSPAPNPLVLLPPLPTPLHSASPPIRWSRQATRTASAISQVRVARQELHIQTVHDIEVARGMLVGYEISIRSRAEAKSPVRWGSEREGVGSDGGRG